MKNYRLDNVRCYQTSKELGEMTYALIRKWDHLNQKTTGIQMLRSVDSIAANIAEGFGRFHKMDKIKFFYNARASVYESAHWYKTAAQRKIISDKDYAKAIAMLQILPKEINYLIKMTKNNLSI